MKKGVDLKRRGRQVCLKNGGKQGGKNGEKKHHNNKTKGRLWGAQKIRNAGSLRGRVWGESKEGRGGSHMLEGQE